MRRGLPGAPGRELGRMPVGMPGRSSTRTAAAIVAAEWTLVVLVVAVGLAPPAVAQRSASPEGIWNLEMRNVAQRATGGVQNKLLRIERVDGTLRGELISPRNEFLQVDEFTFDDGRLHFYFGACEYALEIDGDRMTGVMRSPIDTLQVEAVRQETVLYTGDEPESWVTTRTGVVGHRSEFAPSDHAADPNEWVRSRARSLDDLVLILRGVPVSFADTEAFEDDLWRLAGQRVDVVGAWEGERLRIEGITAAPDEDGR